MPSTRPLKISRRITRHQSLSETSPTAIACIISVLACEPLLPPLLIISGTKMESTTAFAISSLKKPMAVAVSNSPTNKTINYQAVQIVKIKVGDKIADIKEIENNMISTQTQSGIDAQPEEMVKPTENSGNSNSITAAVASIPIDLNMIYNLAEIMPQFPGGEEVLRNYIADNLQNLAQLDEGEKLIIVVSFIVNKDGSISNISTVPESASMVREVKKVIAKMPQWIPGMQNGHKVSVLFKLPITFAGSE